MTYENLHNAELEQSVLSALIFDNLADFNIMTDGLTADCFTDKRLQRLFLAMKTMSEQGLSIHDPMLVIDTMNRTKGEEPELGIPEFLDMVSNDSHRMEVSDNIPQYVAILIDLACRRRVFTLVQQATGQIVDMTQDTEETIDNLVSEMTLSGGDHRATVQTFQQMMDDLLTTVNNNIEGGDAAGLHTGFRRLDHTGGLHASDLVIIAADSSQGKTALATTMAMNMAAKGSLAYYSMEMTPQQLISRMIAHEVGISGTRLTYKRLSDDEQQRLSEVMPRLAVLNDRIFVDERAVTTPESIMQSIRYLHALHNIDCAIVDYLQILGLKQARSQSREQVIADAARRFKNLAKELNIVIILLSQLNRDGSTQNPAPSVSRIRDSGEINEASDLTLLIYRPEVYEGRLFPKPYDDIDTHGTAMIMVAKDRHGSYGGVGSFFVRFRPEYSYFEDADINSLPRRSQKMAGATTAQMPWKQDDLFGSHT